MGKARRHNDQRSKQSPKAVSQAASHGIKRRQHSQIGRKAVPNLSTRTIKPSKGGINQLVKAKVPFSKNDRVLLVGEGDFSFSLSLAKHHEVASILTTSHDSNKQLLLKYPNAASTIRALGQVPDSKHQQREDQQDDAQHEQEWNGFVSDDETEVSTIGQEHLTCTRISILHDIDATALSKKHKKLLDPYGPFTRIVFNFPHVGGLSTDVNRQVRANQELLVGFFTAAVPYLATQERPAAAVPHDSEHEDREQGFEGQEGAKESDDHALSIGQILVTLFEGEPYTLWNIRDLARHCGLQVVESFRFSWAAFPGYQHARTIGNITTGKDRSCEGKRKGAWRGEERDARCYVLRLRQEVTGANSELRKRKRGDVSDDSD